MPATDAVNGYRLVVPPGWKRITTGDGSAASIDRVITHQLRKRSGTDRVLAERELRDVLAQLVSQSESAGALDIYVFAERLRGATVSMSFTVSMTFLGALADDLDDDDFVSLAGYDAEGAQFLDFPGGRLFRAEERTSRTVAEFLGEASNQLGTSSDLDSYAVVGDEATDVMAQAREAQAAGRVLNRTRVSYLAPVPESPGAFLLVVFSCDDSPLRDAQIYMFDAIMTTLSWTA